jgi:uncharacterized protein YhbP (UPF0306 family)
MDKTDQVVFAKNIIKNNIYLTLGTADGDPWVAPLFYCTDPQHNFYFISQLDSLHTRHLLKHPGIAFAIFDSHQKEGSGNGLQVSGKAYLIPENELDEALKWYHTTFIKLTKELLLGPSPYKLFKIVPEKFYILDPGAKVDKRIEVDLN